MDASNSGGNYGEFQLNGDTLTNAAARTTTFIGTKNLDIGNGGAFINNGAFVAQNNATIEANLGGVGNAFDNNGTFTRNTGTGVFTVSGVAFNNAGAVSVQTGKLSLQGGGVSSGFFVTGSGATLQFVGSYNLTNPSSFSGAGTVDFNAASLTGTSVFNSALTLSGPGTWSDASLTFPAGGVTLDASGAVNDGESQLSGATLTIAAGKTLNFVGTQGLDIGSGATIVNSGTFVAQNNQYIDDNFGDTGIFNNKGVFIRNTGTGTFTIGTVTFNNTGTLDQQTGSLTVSGAAFNNAGTVNVQAGTLSLQGGGNGSGSFVVSSGALLQFAGGATYTLSGTSGINGTGTVDFNNGILSGTSNFNSDLTLTGPGTWGGGTLTFPMTGSVIMDASNSGNGEFQLINDTLSVLAGKTATFAGDGNFDMFSGATIVNSGTFVAQNNQEIYNTYGNGAIFNNKGAFIRNSGTGTFTVSNVTFNNTGTVNVQTGTLSLQGGGSATGSFNVSGSNAVLQFVGAYDLSSPSSFSGGGLVDFNSATLTGTSVFNSAVTLSGPGTWYGGVLTFPSGGVTMDASHGAGGEFQLSNETLTIAAGKTLNFVGTNNFDMFSGATIVNSGTFAAQNNESIYNAYANGATFNNQGVFIRNSGTGTFSISNVSFNNTGAVNVQSGTLDLMGGDTGNTTGSFAVSSGAVLQFDTGAFTLAPASSFSGAGTVNFTSGADTVSGVSNLTGTTNFNGATLTAVGTPAFNGPISWTGGQLAGSGTFAANGAVSINATNSGNGEVQISQATLKLAMGKVTTFAGTGNLDMFSGATIVNYGTFVAENNQDIYNAYGNGATFLNNGLFNRNTSTGTFDIGGGITFSNTGTVQAMTGTLEIDGPITQLPASTLTGGTWVVGNGATLLFNGGQSITSNNGDVTLGGPGAIFAAINSLTVNTDAFRVLGNRNFNDPSTFTNTGILQLGGGLFSATSLISGTGGQLLGYGTINAPVQLNANTPVSVSAAGTVLTMSKAISGAGGLITSGPGVLVLAAANTYSGGTTVISGTVQLGNNSALGAATGSLAVNAGTVDLHGFSPTVGALSGSAGAVITNVVAGASTLTVGNAGSSTYAGALNDDGSVALIKNGAGTLTLTGASNYTGSTSVNAGGLTLKTSSANIASLGNTAIAVASGAMFSPILGATPFSTAVNAGATGAGTAGATVTLDPGSIFTMVDGAIGTFNLDQESSFASTAFTIGGASGVAPALSFEIGNANKGTDEIAVTRDVSVLATGGRITIDALAADTSLSSGNYDLITSAGGFSGTGGNGLTLSGTIISLSGKTYDLSLAHSTAADEILTVTVANPPVEYWSGAVNGIWSTINEPNDVTNWRTAATGAVDAQQIPGAATDVYFTVNSGAANLNTTLGQNIAIKGLVFTGAGTSATNSVVIGGTNILTIGADGIIDEVASAAHSISTNVALAATETWTNNSVNTLTVSGPVSGAFGLSTAGPGKLILSGLNTYSGGTTLKAGAVQLGNAFALGAATGNLAVNGGTLDLHGFSPTVAALSGSSGAVITTLVSGTSKLAETNTAAATYAGVLNNGFGVLALLKSGTGTLTLSGASNYTGGTTISAGTLQLGNALALGGAAGSLAVSGGTLDLHGFSPTLGALSGGSGALITTLLPGTATLAESNALATTYAGELNNGSGVLALVKSGTGILTLSGSSNYGGGTTLNSGTVQLGNTFALGAATGVLAVNGGTVDLHGFSPIAGALSGSSGALITTLSSGTATLAVNGAASTLYAGRLNAGSGELSLIKSGGGLLTLTGSSNLGASLVSGSLGAVQISGGGVVSDSTGIAGYGGGRVTVTGSGSKWTNTSALEIGDLGSGTLSITSGGSVSSGGNGYLGFTAGSGGVAAVSGSGSKWTSTPALYVGDLGTGSLTISGGGVVSDGNGYDGYQAGSSGVVAVSGSGSKWTTTNVIEVGVSGTGTIAISAGGAVSDLSGYIGFNTGSSGVVAISGTGSKWTNAGNLIVGDLGTGALTITGGALVSVTGTTTIGRLGILQLDGASTFTTSAMTANGGTVRTLGAVSFTPGVALGGLGMAINSNGFNSTFSGVFSGAGGLVKSGLGTIALTGASTYTGATNVTAGTLALTTASSHTASLGNTAITVASGAVFAPTLGATPFSTVVNMGTTGTSSAGAKLTLSPGSGLSMVDGALGTLNLQENSGFVGAGLVIGGASGVAPSLAFEIGNAGAGTDQIDVSMNVSVLATGGKITIDPLSGDTSLSAGNYDLINAAGGFSGTDGNGLTLSSSTISLDGSTYSLTLANSTTTTEVLSVSLDPTPPERMAEEQENLVGPRDSLYEPGTVRTAARELAPELAKPPIGTAAVPEPENWASGIAAIVAVALLARRSRGRRCNSISRPIEPAPTF
jgi:T5SS/PEP-CTERM-associated repeat protein/autotransporter-associated beta strand protein